MSTAAHSAEKVREAIRRASRGLVEREIAVELVALAAIAGEHVLLVGPPGTGKSEAARRISRALGGQYFEYLLGRFTEPSEIFGPVNLRRLREGVVETETAGMLPEAEIAFLDEVFRGSTAILNTLLGVLNERLFRRGHTNLQCPLRVCVGATNELPSDPSLAAFADRFLVHLFVTAVPDERLEDLLEQGGAVSARAAAVADMTALDRLAEAARSVELASVRPELARAVRTLRGAGIDLSDRRIVRVQRLVAAASALDGRDTATVADLWPLLYAVPTADLQSRARDVLRDLLAASANASTPHAAEEASAGPAARAARLVATADQLLSNRPEGDTDAGWMLRLEGVVREIDAGFPADALPEDLGRTRAAVVDVLQTAR